MSTKAVVEVGRNQPSPAQSEDEFMIVWKGPTLNQIQQWAPVAVIVSDYLLGFFFQNRRLTINANRKQSCR